ncbi:MAG: hypothetical protein IPL96_02890 [Holophagaceae bacterium]|nr:hypothetical protein [Holophagaceae bacterium]
MPDPTIDQRSPGAKNVLAAWAPLIVLSLFSSNPMLTLASLAVLYVLINLLWRPGEPPILLYVMGYQWLQANILIFYADLQGLPLTAVEESTYVVEATWLTMIGLLMVILGIRLGAGRSFGQRHQQTVADLAAKLSVRRLFIACLIAIPFGNGLAMVAFGLGGLAQPILALANLHWVLVYLFAYTVMAKRSGYSRLAVVFGIELISGFLGYFSDFKTVLILLLLAVLAAPGVFRGLRLQMAAGLVAVTLALGIFWTGIKTDYRDFVSQGSSAQVALVPVSDRIEKLVELAGDLTPEKLLESTEKLMLRLTYVHYFGECMKTVPSHIPYENGKLWWEAVTNAVVPRVLNPSKANLDDTLRAMFYTGEWIIGADYGTSVSLGYMAESYIDFGPVLMFVPLFLWGLLIGAIYRASINATAHPLIGYACATVPIYMSAGVLELSNAKMLGGLVLGFGILYLVQRQLSARAIKLLLLPRDPFPYSAAAHAKSRQS